MALMWSVILTAVTVVCGIVCVSTALGVLYLYSAALITGDQTIAAE